MIWLITAVCALLAAALCFGLAAGAPRGRAALIGRGLVAVVAGVLVAELLTTALLSGAVSERIDTDARAAADGAPAVVAAQSARDRAVAERTAADRSVEQARAARDQALVVARCEYRPTAGCPQVAITGDPGRGPEATTANDRLAAAQAELDRASASRDARVADLDARVTDADATLAAARGAAVTDADRGLGARWVAMNSVTADGGGPLVLRIGLWLLCAAAALLPLLFRIWRGVTARDVWAEQELEREKISAAAQLEIDAHSARHQVALVRGEAPDDTPTMQFTMPDGWQVTARRYLRELPPEPAAPALPGRSVPAHRRTADGTDAPRDDARPGEFLPIAAAAEAASLGGADETGTAGGADETGTVDPTTEAAGLDSNPAAPFGAEAEENDPVAKHAAPEPNLPAVVAETRPVPARAAAPAPLPVPADRPDRKPNPFLPPVVDDVAQAAARWARPFLPPIVSRVLDGSASPMRSARQAFEEVEEVTFSLRRSRKVTVDSTAAQPQPAYGPPDFPEGAFASPDFVAQHFAGTGRASAGAGLEPIDVPYEVDGATVQPLDRGRRGELPR